MSKLIVAEMRDLESQVSKGEISYSRMVEIINQKFNPNGITKHEDLFESIEILFADCIRMKENATLQNKIGTEYEKGFFAGVIQNCKNTERLLKQIIDDYNNRIV